MEKYTKEIRSCVRLCSDRLRDLGYRITPKGWQVIYRDQEGRVGTIHLGRYGYPRFNVFRWNVDGYSIVDRGKVHVPTSKEHPVSQFDRAAELTCAPSEIMAFALWWPQWIFAKKSDDLTVFPPVVMEDRNVAYPPGPTNKPVFGPWTGGYGWTRAAYESIPWDLIFRKKSA